MSIVNHHERPELSPAVAAVLDEVRRRVRWYVWLEGAAAALVWLGVAFWATLAIDWFFEPPAMVREAMLAFVAVVLAAVLLHLIGRRAGVRISDGNVATLLERRFPQLGDSLLTAVAIVDCSIPENEIDAEMAARTCRLAAERIAGVDARKVFNYYPLRLKCIGCGLLIFSVILFACVLPNGIGVWASRMLAMSDALWPRSTRLEVVDFGNGARKIARGSDIEILARADATKPVVPQVVEIRYRTEGGNRGRATMDRRGTARGPEDKYQEYAYTFRSVLADIHFDVVGGDDRVANQRIEVVDSPTISEMTLECELPGYMGRKVAPMPVSGVMQIPMGSRVTVRAKAANKDLVRVEINGIVGDRSTPLKVLEVGELNDDHRGFSYAVDRVMKDVTLLFTLTDTDGIKSRDPVRLALAPLPDQPPQLAVQLDGIGSAVTAKARAPVVGRISDDYGIGRVWFEVGVDQREPVKRPIRDFVTSGGEHPTDFAVTDAALELGELSLKPGQKLAVRVRASDLCDLDGEPNVASGERWMLDVVTPEQLRVMLETRELMLRQRFDRMIQEMTETRDLVARLEFGSSVATIAKPRPANAGKRPDDEESPDSPARQAALRLMRVEGALTNCRKSTQEVLGVAEAFDDIRKQLINNRIDTEELRKRLQEGIAEPLRKIADPMFPELERRLESLRSALDDAAKGPALRDQTRQQADEILLAMRKVRDRMIELEDFNEALELLRGIIQTQEQIREQTQQRHKQKIRDLLKD